MLPLFLFYDPCSVLISLIHFSVCGFVLIIHGHTVIVTLDIIHASGEFNFA